jgi:hypothetical protein
MMMTRPQTLGYGLADSLLGYMTNSPIVSLCGGEPERALTRDEMLDYITLYWHTNTGTSSSELYWENPDNVFKVVDISIPVGVTVFPGDIYRAPRSWAERNYHKLIYWRPLRGVGTAGIFRRRTPRRVQITALVKARWTTRTCAPSSTATCGSIYLNPMGERKMNTNLKEQLATREGSQPARAEQRLRVPS